MKIIIGLVEHMGDIVACEPVSRYLRKIHPGAHITWAVSGAYRELVDSNPVVDDVAVMGCLTEWIRLAKHSSYDQVIDLHVNYRVCQCCRVPLIKEHGNPFVNVFDWLNYGSLLEAFSLGAGLPRLTAAPRVYIGPEHVAAVDALQLPADYCVIHRESNSAEKDWSDSNWQLFAEWIARSLKIAIVEVGVRKGSKPSPLAGRAVDLIDRTSILGTAEVIRRARLFIGVDSGPAHLANAVRTPGIVLLGRVGGFRKYTPFNGLYAGRAPEAKLVRNLNGPVREIHVADVIEAANYIAGILAQRQADGTPPTIETDDFAEAGAMGRGGLLKLGRSANPSAGAALDASVSAAEIVVRQDDAAPMRLSAFMEDDAPPDEPGAGLPADEMPKLFAFYLPQFHPIAENDWAHGSGFTEWTNVVKAKPLFDKHYQPRIPGELGYYDLRAMEVMREQVRLALEHGITGFCFYYYYFSGRKLLYKPIANYIESDIEAPFFFLWANENWSKRWDGGDKEIIIEQSHSTEDDLAFIRDLVETFSDRRYVKIGGKPLLLIYKAHLFPDIRKTTDVWRTEIVEHGFPDLYLVMVDDWSADPRPPIEWGFDASYEIPSNLVPAHVIDDPAEWPGLADDFSGRIVDYRKFAEFHMARPFPEYKRFRTVMAPWDNTPRYGSRAMVHVNTDGDAYKLWLTQALSDTRRRYGPEERIVLLHSWNEWCEGTYVEPDGRLGRRRLEDTREAVAGVREAVSLDPGGAEHEAIVMLRRIGQRKDEAAFRMIQAFRGQFAGVDPRGPREQLLQHLLSSSWKVTAPLRGLGRMVGMRRIKFDPEERNPEALRALIRRVRRSVSWKVTRPLRSRRKRWWDFQP